MTRSQSQLQIEREITERFAAIERLRRAHDSGEEYVTGIGQKLVNVHKPSACAGEFCPVHNPSNHPMKNFKTLWRGDRGLMERICEHGVGHPDPDHIAHTRRLYGDEAADTELVHGCDGCCQGAYS